MLTPKQIQDLADPIEEIYIRMVDELLVNIGRHITSPTWTHTASWEIQKLAELGQLTQENAAIINAWIKQMPDSVRQTMEATRAAALDRLEKQLEQAAQGGYIQQPVTDTTVQVLRDALQQAEDRFNLVNTTMLQSSVEQYSRAVQLTEQEYQRMEAQKQASNAILNEAALSIASGIETRQTAINRAIKRISDEGLTGFIDRAGRSWTPEAYVNMVTRTTVHNVAIESTKARMQDYNTQVFQVSSHAGARPLCYPYQGKFYSWDNSAGEIPLGNGTTVRYEPLNSTSYGQAAGLFGINCGHFPIPIIPGVTIPHGADNIQPKEENDREYKESQEQRALERQIREAKRNVEMLGDAATKEDKQKVRELQAKMREFTDRTGRARRYDRESISGAGQGKSGTKEPEIPQQVVDVPQTTAEPLPEKTPVAETIDFGGSKASLTDEQQEVITSMLSKLEQEYPLNGSTLAFVGDFRARRGIGFNEELDDLLDRLEVEEKQRYYGVGAQFLPLRDGPVIEYIDTTMVSNTTARESFEMIHQAKERSPGPAFNAGYGLEADTIHEYGHALAYVYGFYGSQDPEFVKLFEGLDKEKIKEELSIYAATNWNEFFAEAFLQSFSPYQSDMSKLAMDYFRRKMK